MRYEKLLFAMMLAALVLGADAATTDASTVRRFPGHNCQPDAGSYYVIDLHSDGYSNDSSTTRYAWCPIGGYQSNTIQVNSAYFYVYDATTVTEVKCRIAARPLTGSAIYGGYESSGVSASGQVTISYTADKSLPLNGGSMSSIVNLGFQCIIPGDAIDWNGYYSNLRGYVAYLENP